MQKKSFEILNWDSKHFGYKVAKIKPKKLSEKRLRDLLAKLSDEKVKLVYWLVNPHDRESNQAAQSSGGFLADEKITYLKNISWKLKKVKNYKDIISYRKKPLNDTLKRLALEAGKYSRFKIDSNFKNNEFEIVYEAWIKNSLNGKLAYDVLVFRKERNIAGFVTISEKNARADIGLIAIDKKYQGKGIGRHLIEYVLIKSSRLGYKKLQVVTQKANIGACLFYEKVGFKVESVSNVYHFWLDGKKTSRIPKE